jgi:hypothetical protein
MYLIGDVCVCEREREGEVVPGQNGQKSRKPFSDDAWISMGTLLHLS